MSEPIEKTFLNILNENNGHGFLAASMLGLAGIGVVSAIDANQIETQALQLGIKVSPSRYGDHQSGGLIKPIYSFKYDGKSEEYGNNIEGLCKYIKRYRRADDVTYTDEGDHYKIHAKYTFTHYVNKCRRTDHTECDLDLPKDFFNVSFSLKESKFVGMIYNLDNSWDTFYIDEDGEMVDSVKLAKIFDNEDDAEEWAYENRPVGWGAYGSKIKESVEDVFSQILRENKKLKEASFTIGEFCRYKGIENPEAFRDFLRKLWNFNHIELWTQSDSDSLERALESFCKFSEGRVFAHSSGFGLHSGHNYYEEPKKEPIYIATETNEDDGELYFDETGCSTEFEIDAKKFTSEKDALEFAKNNVIFGEPGVKRLTESLDSTGAAFNLTKLKGYLSFETTWHYDRDDYEDAILVDKVHDPARFTVNWIGPEGKKHPNTYCVNIRKDMGESWTWVTHFCSKASDAAEIVNHEVRTWERNNEPWRFN